jgi:GTP-binding protein LepA
MNAGTIYHVEEVGVLKLKYLPTQSLSAGEVGYCICGIKDIAQAKVGDTITEPQRPTARPHPGYKELKPFVFAGLYPVSPADYEALKKALEKLHLTDSAFQFGPETSTALGFGFRCGFLGLLHLDIVQQRLEREFSLNLLATAPNTSYRLSLNNGTVRTVDNPALFPPHGDIRQIEEPYVSAQIVVPSQYVGEIMPLCQDHRGKFIDLRYITTERALLRYELPLAEIIIQFYDQLKSVSKGYASFDYEHIGYRPDKLVRLDILVAGEPVDALSYVVHQDNAYHWGRLLAQKLKELIPRQMFEVPIQARIESRIIARETIPAVRKDVLAKCYGGDITRKRKLLEKQKEGKKRMKQFGKVEIPQDAFLAVLKLKETP